MSESKDQSPDTPSGLSAAPELPDGHLLVQALDLDAQGVARKPDGKVVFIDGALPTEVVSANTQRKKNNWEQASLTAIHRESSQRVRPACPHFGLHAGACGGCKMQHLDMAAQVAVKQRVLEDNLWHLGKVRAETLLRPIEGPSWGYRYRARLSVRHVLKKGVVLVGFHERKSRYMADMQTCKILPPHVDALLMPLRALIARMDARDTCPQIELACGDTVTALVLRHLEPLSEATSSNCAPLPRPMACNGGCSPRVRTRCICSTKPWSPWRMRCPTSASPCRSSPPISRRSTRTSTACWCRVRCACWRCSPRARDRLVLRPGQLHAAAGHPGARGAGH
jgi:hypothetical protein